MVIYLDLLKIHMQQRTVKMLKIQIKIIIISKKQKDNNMNKKKLIKNSAIK